MGVLGTSNKSFVHLLGHLVLHLAFHAVAGFEFLQVFCAILVQGDADGEALLHLDKIASGIVDGDERKSTTCGIGKAEHTAFVGHVRHRVHMNAHFRAALYVRQLALAIVRLHPFLVLIHDADKRLTGVDQFADVDVTTADHAGMRGDDVTIREVQFRQINRRLRQLDCRFGRREVKALLSLYALLHLYGVANLLITGLRGKVRRVRLLIDLLRDRACLEQLLVAVIFALQVVHVRFRLGFGRLGHLDIAVRRADGRTGLLALLTRTGKVTLCLCQTQAELAVFKDDQRVAFANMLVRLKTNILNKTLHTRVLRRDVLAYAGIVRVLDAPEMSELQHNVRYACEKKQHDNRVVQIRKNLGFSH